MQPFMVICRFKEGTDMGDVMAVIEEEQAQVKVLENQGRIGSIHLSLARSTVFIEVFADDESGADATVRTLPMSRWWELDVYLLAGPIAPAVAS